MRMAIAGAGNRTDKIMGTRKHRHKSNTMWEEVEGDESGEVGGNQIAKGLACKEACLGTRLRSA